MVTVTVDVWGVAYGEPEVGLWCEACALPSVIRMTVSVGTGLRELFRFRLTECTDCGERSEDNLPIPKLRRGPSARLADPPAAAGI